jgi:ubiquinol-cytochrome c reductase cytochrome c subunit
VRRAAAGAVALAAVAAALAAPAAPGRAQRAGDPARGRALFATACSYCHGTDGRGRSGRGPSVVGAGAQAADFYLRTGRMPLAEPKDYPVRTHPAYPAGQIDDLVAYVASLGGPPIPAVHPERGVLSRGRELFQTNCAGCHQVVAQGGVVTGAVAPPLQRASATQIAQAIRIGPYLMPPFSQRQLSAADVDDIARYVLSTRHPEDRGGWGIGHIGPVPEGMVAWLVGLAALLGLARLIGEGAPR